jgi:hypothetical protein
MDTSTAWVQVRVFNDVVNAYQLMYAPSHYTSNEKSMQPSLGDPKGFTPVISHNGLLRTLATECLIRGSFDFDAE